MNKMPALSAVCALFFLCFLHFSNSGGRALVSNQGNTGAPGDELLPGTDNPRTCQSCHNGGAYNASVVLNLTDLVGNTVSHYEPGASYIFKAEVLHAAGTPGGFGMQMVALIDESETDVVGWSNASTNAHIQTASITGRSYVEQNDVSVSPIFSATWTAPAAEAGAITFYASGNAVNNNGTSSGDNGAKKSLTIQPINTNTENYSRDLPALSLLYSPTPNQLMLQTQLAESGDYLVRVFDLNGQLLYQTHLPLIAGLQRTQLDAQQLPAGAVLVHLAGRGRQFTTKGLVIW